VILQDAHKISHAALVALLFLGAAS